MNWKVEFDPAAERRLGKIDRQIAKRILAFFHDRVAQLDDPCSLWNALRGFKLENLWKYRVGDYRILFQTNPFV